MKSNDRECEPRVLVCLYDLSLWVMKATNRYPRNWRVTLGDRLDRVMLDMLVLAQQACLRREKKALLQELSDLLESLRILIRLSRDLGCLDLRRYEYAAKQMDEIGRQLGGWMKQQHRKPFHEDVETSVS